MIILIN